MNQITRADIRRLRRNSKIVKNPEHGKMHSHKSVDDAQLVRLMTTLGSVMAGNREPIEGWMSKASDMIADNGLGAMKVVPEGDELGIYLGLTLRGAAVCDLAWGSGLSPSESVRREGIKMLDETDNRFDQLVRARIHIPRD
jgi:hypothetical protein